MAKKTVNFNQKGISQLPNDKPIMYKILTGGGTNNYTGIAQRGRVQDRLNEHVGNIPGAKVQIQQFESINDARKSEGRVISRSKPKYNEQGK